MEKKALWTYRWERVKEFLPSFKPLSKKGSPTLEYVIIIAAGAAFAGLLLFAFKGGEDNEITKTLRTKVNDVVDKSGNLEEAK
ncbi:hypothetical protein ADL26_02095 [Thermoactinomyces vulgaris]|jgi:hypothetical protein|uniref:Uncharacterized protein n=1 Tax=Laceyella tengchongensis TaxID=574699 RepID=A0AA45WRD1_9BACL|nr:hypothetical protein [Laceyella tengchongensis]KPC77554.1 hypothetical protein ADL26_02095 [Thermoactinomyces vulgaris]SMP30725.1 hypothetical protein SAMN06265361_107105 [Laceyella tengchongensis]